MPNYEVVAPAGQTLEALKEAQTAPPFDASSMAFVSDLSRAILADASFKRFPEMIAFAFWTREAQLQRLKTGFEQKAAGALLMARGRAFHIAPGNVDTIFLYSLVLSLLVGNVNIVRLSRRRSDQVEGVIRVLRGLLDTPKHASVRNRLGLVRYEHDNAVTALFSSVADVRLIWGGDETVRTVRAIPLPTHAVELTFADKLSLAVLGAEAWLAADNKPALAGAFVNDAYWFAQMACSSPRAVIWVGDERTTNEARKSFWATVEQHLLAHRPDLAPIDFVNKLVAEQSLAIDHGVRVGHSASNLVRIVEGVDLEKPPADLAVGGGLFADVRIDALGGLVPFITRRTQTIATYGVPASDWRSFVVEHQPRGLDRVTPLGDALTFASVWDGHDLLRALTREVSITVR
jgi:hypothetical protein